MMEIFARKEFWEFLLANLGLFLVIFGMFLGVKFLIDWSKSKSTLDSEFLRLDDADFTDSDFTNGSFNDLSVQRVKFINANLTNVVFNNIDLTGSDFTGAILNNTKFIDCIMTDVIIDKSKVKILNPELN